MDPLRIKHFLQCIPLGILFENPAGVIPCCHGTAGCVRRILGMYCLHCPLDYRVYTASYGHYRSSIG